MTEQIHLTDDLTQLYGEVYAAAQAFPDVPPSPIKALIERIWATEAMTEPIRVPDDLKGLAERDALKAQVARLTFALKNTKALIDGEAPRIWGLADIQLVEDALIAARKEQPVGDGETLRDEMAGFGKWIKPARKEQP